MKELKVAVAGLGTVGAGAVRLLQQNADRIERSAGRPIKVVAVSARDKERVRDVGLKGIDFVQDALTLADRPDVDVVCELIGGHEGVARTLCEKTLSGGKSLVTANKALLAHRGVELAALAEKNGVHLLFEASVGGGIPVIKTLREATAGNNIQSVQGIMNGTCNYILTRMTHEHLDFSEALARAQQLGYAEADPSADVDGIDTAHKLCVLSALAFGVRPDLNAVSIEGIRRISSLDLDFASRLGYRVKLLGVARRREQGIEQRVGPCLVPVASALAPVDGVLNAIQVDGDAVGPLTLIGRGAGSAATASAVIGDLIDVARGARVNPWIASSADLLSVQAFPPEKSAGRWYIRLQVTDKPGVLADIAAILRNQAISIESLLQQGQETEHSVPVIIVTHATNEAMLRAALAQIAKLEAVWEEPFCLRIEK